MNISNYSPLAPITEYETIIDTIINEVMFYKKEQDNLRSEITILISENKILTSTVNHLLQEQTNHQCVRKVETPLHNELIQNLKTQLSCAEKEKEAVVELWQTALKTIDNVENTLNFYEGKTHGHLSNTQVSNIKILQDKHTTKLNTQIQKCQEDLNTCRKILNIKNNELTKALERESTSHTLLKSLESEVQHFNKRLQDVTNMNTKLQATLEIKNQKIIELQTKENEAKRKVSEALQIVEAACLEKDAALARENEVKKEVINISKDLTELIDETTEKVKSETENIKQGYKNKLKKVEDDMLNLQKRLEEKNAEITKYLQESLLLTQELDRIKRGHVCVEESHTSKLLILEKNLESTFQKLLLSEKRNLQLEAEKESIKCDLEQMANSYKNDIKIRETEKEVLKKQLKTLKIQLRASDTNVIQGVNKAKKLKAQIKHLDVIIREKLNQQQILHEHALSSSIKGIQTNSSQIQEELQHHIQMQRCLNKKIKKEMIYIINELEKKMEELKLAKKSLEKELQSVVKDNLYYKENLHQFCTKVISLVDINSENSVNPAN